jgi:hypothetical protein
MANPFFKMEIAGGDSCRRFVAVRRKKPQIGLRTAAKSAQNALLHRGSILSGQKQNAETTPPPPRTPQ